MKKTDLIEFAYLYVVSIDPDKRKKSELLKKYLGHIIEEDDNTSTIVADEFADLQMDDLHLFNVLNKIFVFLNIEYK
ncbi:MAG: hypothetical protein ACTSW1_07500 [Candidatus Hodarchaeales archaeon]